MKLAHFPATCSRHRPGTHRRRGARVGGAGPGRGRTSRARQPGSRALQVQIHDLHGHQPGIRACVVPSVSVTRARMHAVKEEQCCGCDAMSQWTSPTVPARRPWRLGAAYVCRVLQPPKGDPHAWRWQHLYLRQGCLPRAGEAQGVRRASGECAHVSTMTLSSQSRRPFLQVT